MILSCDPGTTQTAYAILDESDNLKVICCAKVDNEDLLNNIESLCEKYNVMHCAIEMIASYGMAVGVTTFETVFWIGRFYQKAIQYIPVVERIYRKDEKMNLCGTMKAKDTNIRQALIDRFGVVGTKANKGWFYGVTSDCWAAISTGITYADIYITGKYVR